MKYLLPILLSTLFAGCSVAPAIQERMIIAPHAIVFPSSTSDSAVSITHSCTCPFSWNATISPSIDTAWLTFQTSMTGDKSDVPISIHRSLLTADTNRATILILSNSYGNDSIAVTAIR